MHPSLAIQQRRITHLFDNSFKLVMDHVSLKWIMTTHKLTGKLARWSLFSKGI